MVAFSDLDLLVTIVILHALLAVSNALLDW